MLAFGSRALTIAFPLLAVAATSAGGGGSANFLPHRLCARMLTVAAAGGDAAIERITDAYVELLTGPGAGLVSLEELRAMLDSGQFFELPEGSSARDHVRDGLRELETAARALTADHPAILVAVRERLARLVREMERTAKSANEERSTRRAVPENPRKIALPRQPTRNPSLPISANIETLADTGAYAVLAFPLFPFSNRQWLASTAPGASAPLRPLKNASLYQFSRDGTLLSCQDGGSVTVLDTASGKEVGVFPQSMTVQTHVLTPDSRRLLIQGYDRNADRRRWFVTDIHSRATRELETGELLPEGYGRHLASGTFSLAFSDDGAVAGLWSFHSGFIRYHFWRLADGKLLDSFSETLAPEPIGKEIRPPRLQLSPDGKTALIGYRTPRPDGTTVAARDLASHSDAFALDKSAVGDFNRAAYSPDMRLVAAYYRHGTRALIGLWDARTGAAVKADFRRIQSRVDPESVRLIFSDGGSRLAIVEDFRSQEILGVPDARPISKIDLDWGMEGTRFSGNGAVGVQVEGDVLRVWDIGELMESRNAWW